MTVLAAVLGLAFTSALVPVVNIEAVVAVACTQSSAAPILLALAAGVGQMAGKLLWYWGGSNVQRAPWVARRLAKPKPQAALERWRVRVHGRPYLTGAILFASASFGFPPFAVMSVLAGAIRVPLPVFLVIGLIGRSIRFYAVASGADLASDWW